MSSLKLLKPKVITDGGPWAHHNMPCAIYNDEHAVLDLNGNVFMPSWKAQKEGWKLIKINNWRHKLLWKLLGQ